MTFYFCHGEDIMKIRYDIGNAYFPDDFLSYATASDIEARAAKDGRELEIFYEPDALEIFRGGLNFMQ